MNLNTRSVGLAVLLLLLFLAAAVALQAWLVRETRQLQASALAEQKVRLERALDLAKVPPERWDQEFQREVGALLGGSIQLFPAGRAPAPLVGKGGGLTLTTALPNFPGWEARLHFAAPALTRVQVLHQRILATIVLLALMLAVLPILLVVLGNRRGGLPEGASRAPWVASKTHAAGLAQLARLSHERTAELAQEHAARARAEENLEVNRSLLDRSVAERVRLGRELHDNICQTLYAVCLTLESVQKKSGLSPEMDQRTRQCLDELRRLNREVRAYLQDLEPGHVNSQSFGTALAGLLGSLPPEAEARIERRLDPAALELIPSHQVADIMNILREALSNSLRHGQAQHILLRAAQSDQAIALSVQDDGAGFASPTPRTGHGLQNMRARAEALGGRLSVESNPGQGTRIVLTLPVAVVA